MHTDRTKILWKRRTCRLIRGHFKSNGTIGIICTLSPRRQNDDEGNRRLRHDKNVGHQFVRVEVKV